MQRIVRVSQLQEILYGDEAYTAEQIAKREARVKAAMEELENAQKALKVAKATPALKIEVPNGALFAELNGKEILHYLRADGTQIPVPAKK